MDSTISRTEIARPSWEDYYLGLAYTAAQRSHDADTKVGCVIADAITHRILGLGYNGFPKNIDDSSLPNSRPKEKVRAVHSKYSWMIHAEKNAIANCGDLAFFSPVAYITLAPCNDCAMHLWQHGIKSVYVPEVSASSSRWFDDEQKEKFEEFVQLTGFKVNFVRPNLTWLRNIPIDDQFK